MTDVPISRANTLGHRAGILHGYLTGSGMVSAGGGVIWGVGGSDVAGGGFTPAGS